MRVSKRKDYVHGNECNSHKLQAHLTHFSLYYKQYHTTWRCLRNGNIVSIDAMNV